MGSCGSEFQRIREALAEGREQASAYIRELEAKLDEAKCIIQMVAARPNPWQDDCRVFLARIDRNRDE